MPPPQLPEQEQSAGPRHNPAAILSFLAEPVQRVQSPRNVELLYGRLLWAFSMKSMWPSGNTRDNVVCLRLLTTAAEQPAVSRLHAHGAAARMTFKLPGVWCLASIFLIAHLPPPTARCLRKAPGLTNSSRPIEVDLPSER